jgi:hypothetical protein
MASNPIVRPLRAADLITAYGSLLQAPAEGLAVEIDGILAGVTGILYTVPIQAFSTICDDRLRKYPKVIMMTGRKMTAIMDKIGLTVMAVANPLEKNSGNFLLRFGFNYAGETSQGRVYQRCSTSAHC